MDNNDNFTSLGLDGVTLQDTQTRTPNPLANDADASADKDLDNLTNEETIDLFVRGIMEEKGINAPTEEIEESIYNDLKTKLLEQIDRSLVAELPDDKLEELSKIALEQGQIDPNIIAKMIEESNLDVAEITGITMERFREIYLGEKDENEIKE